MRKRQTKEQRRLHITTLTLRRIWRTLMQYLKGACLLAENQVPLILQEIRDTVLGPATDQLFSTLLMTHLSSLHLHQPHLYLSSLPLSCFTHFHGLVTPFVPKSFYHCLVKLSFSLVNCTTDSFFVISWIHYLNASILVVLIFCDCL